MVALNSVINADDIPARDDFTPVPPGTYTGMITGSEMKPTANGEMLVLTVEIQDGENAGRKIFERLNLKNNSNIAVKIAYQTLGEIIRACGKTTIKDSDELHGKRMSMDVVVDPAKAYMKDGVQQPGSPQNRVKKYATYGAVPAGALQAASAAPNQAASAAAAATLPPWKR